MSLRFIGILVCVFFIVTGPGTIISVSLFLVCSMSTHDKIRVNKFIRILLSLQFTVRARDNHAPERTTEVTVLVKVNRNNYLPSFQGQPYNTALSENKGTGNSVLTVVARDQDVQVRISVFDVVRPHRCHASSTSKAIVDCIS